MSIDPSSVPSDEELLSPPENADVETLRLARSEARFVLDHQLNAFDRLADKTMWTLRFSLVVLGVVVSVATFGGVDRFLNPFTVAGVACLSASVVVGLATFASGRPTAGISTDHIEDCLSASYAEAEWLAVLLAGYRSWMTETAATNQLYAKLFGVTHALTGLGVVLLVVSWVSSLVFGTGVLGAGVPF
jgi:hypothetical protein